MIKKLTIFIISIVVIVALAHSLGFFSNKEYTELNHGNHIHYVPHDRNPDVPLDNFPMTKPKPDERIMPDGRIVKK